MKKSLSRQSSRTAASFGRATPPSTAVVRSQPLNAPEAASVHEAASTSRSLYELSVVADVSPSSAPAIPPAAWAIAAVAGAGLAAYGISKSFDQGSRPYSGNVGSEYDAWTEEGILEYYVSIRGMGAVLE